MNLKTKNKKHAVREALGRAMENDRHGHSTRLMVRTLGESNVLDLAQEIATPGFNRWSALRESIMRAARRGVLREAAGDSVFSPLLRFGVENIVLNPWEAPPTAWDQVIMVKPSNGAYGVYGSTYRISMVGEVPAGGEFNRSKVLPDEKILRNKKFGGMLSFETELFEDDQTGEIGTKSSDLGIQHQQLKEIWFAGMIQAKQYTFGTTKVPAPAYTDPDGLAGVYVVARGNRPSSFAALTMATFQEARRSLMVIKDPLGNLVGRIPDTLLVAPNVEYDANRIMNSSWTPNNVGSTGTPTFPTDFNPIKGMAKVVVCRYLPDNAWFLGYGKSRSLIHQQRTALSVLQEDPASGESFKFDSYNYRSRERWAYGWVLGGARFWYEGNDGSVSQPSPTP